MVIKRTREFYEVVQRAAGRYSRPPRCRDTNMQSHLACAVFHYSMFFKKKTTQEYKYPLEYHKKNHVTTESSNNRKSLKYIFPSTASLIEMIGTATPCKQP